MVRVIHKVPNIVGDEQGTTTPESKPKELKLLKEVSIHDKIREDKSSENENDLHDQVFYDALDELEDFEKLEPISVQLRNGKENTIKHMATKLQNKRNNKLKCKQRLKNEEQSWEELK